MSREKTTTSAARAAGHPITGNTYPVKDKLRALGCRWDGQRKCWMAMSDEMATAAKAIVAGQAPLNNPIAVPQDTALAAEAFTLK